MKGKDQPDPLEAVQVLQYLFVQPVGQLQGGKGSLTGRGPLHHRTLVGGVDPAAVGRTQDADRAVAVQGVTGHGANASASGLS